MSRLFTGTVLPYSHLIDLLRGLTYEGHCAIGSPAALEDYYHLETFQSVYGDILTSLVLFGEARLRCPSYLAEHIDAEALVREGLIEFDNRDSTVKFRERIGKTYQLAFQKFRELEVNPASTTLVNWDRLVYGGRSSSKNRIKAATDWEDAVFYHNQLIDLISPLRDALGGIYEYYFAWNQISNHDLLLLEPDLDSFYEDYDGDYPDDATNDSSRSILSRMGLRVLRGLELDKAKHSSRDPFSYTPDDFNKFERQNKVFMGGLDHYEPVVGFADRRDPEDFRRIHVYWRTFFEILNLLAYAEEVSAPLFIPSVTRIGDDKGSPKLLTTESMIRVYRIFLTQSGLLPTPRTFEDVLRLRDDRNLNSLRRALATWVEQYPALDSDPSFLPEVRAEISAASKVVARTDSLTKIASISGYIALPVGVAEYIIGHGVIGLALAPIGPAVDTYNSFRLRKFGWVKFGK